MTLTPKQKKKEILFHQATLGRTKEGAIYLFSKVSMGLTGEVQRLPEDMICGVNT
jgi:hypothetical protein